MGTICNTVQYCCVCNGAKVLCAYNNGGDDEIEKLAALCLQKAPSHHRWYFQTMFNKTFGFLMEDGYVYFAIIGESLGNPKNLEFLEHVRDAFKKVAKKGLKRILSNPNSLVLEEQLLPVIRRLINSLEHVSNDLGPLLEKSDKQEKIKMRDHVITVKESERKSADKQGSKVDSLSPDLDNRGGSVAVGVSLTKEVSSVSRSRTQTVRNKWYRQVRIVLAVDVAVCLVLFVVWMVVCRGTECIR